MIQMTELKNAIPDAWTGKGFFSAMTAPPWAGEDLISSLNLDIQLIAKYGDRLTNALVGHYTLPLSDNDRKLIAGLILEKFRTNWKHLYDSLKLVYAPIDNYDSTEEESITETITDKGSETRADTGKQESQGSSTQQGTASGNNDVYGFNSEQAVPSDKNSSENQLTGSESQTVDTTNNGTSSHDNENTRTHSRKLSRHGNIGVTTSQQMLESEYALWTLHNVEDMILQDCIKMVTLPIY